MRSSRHPNYQIEKSENTYFMSHDDGGYIIEVTEYKGEWYGEILTEQKLEDLPGETEWLPAQTNPMFAPIAEVEAEVNKRAAYWKNN